jgi:benzoyl-CoA reductase/2-hydroxyglutaryl-CoA dehydratase subunit BcrC/BadD/HgdB
VVASGDYTVPKLVEESGGIIVANLLDDGVWHERYNIKTEGDLLENVAHTYFLDRVPPPVFQPSWDNRWEYLLSVIREYQIDGVIWYQLSFEEIYDMECSVVMKRLSEANVPVLKLESAYEYSREAMAPLVTRIESFVGSIGGTRRIS